MNELKIFNSVKEFIEFRKQIHPDIELGLVPTMGALHQGHASLIKQSYSENDLTVLSIFINPTQFNDPTDFTKYPKTWTDDLKIASDSGADIVISPIPEEIYFDNYRYKVTESDFSKRLCGAHRPGHFDGVLTVVLKLLMLVRPSKSYFGEKDYQQLQLIKDMVASFFISTEVIGCPTFRENSGLAMSSRNMRLSESARIKAASIFKCLSENVSAAEVKNNLSALGFDVDYVEDEGSRRFVAATLEGIRLIDNVKIK